MGLVLEPPLKVIQAAQDIRLQLILVMEQVVAVVHFQLVPQELTSQVALEVQEH